MWGPFHAQGELITSMINTEISGKANLWGCYVQGGWFLTGENRPYNREEGLFGRVRPKRSFSFTEYGLGGLELALRFSYIDLNDRYIDGGLMSILMGGLNWHLNFNTRLEFNTGLVNVDHAENDGRLLILQSRLLVYF